MVHHVLGGHRWERLDSRTHPKKLKAGIDDAGIDDSLT
jgi:hypothetical protein